jgi:hypothetical protein
MLRGKWEEVSGRTWKDARNERGERPKSALEERAFKARVKRLTRRTGFSPLWWPVEERRFSAALGWFLVYGMAEAVPLPKPFGQSCSGIGVTTADSSVAQNSRSVGMTIQKRGRAAARCPSPTSFLAAAAGAAAAHAAVAAAVSGHDAAAEAAAGGVAQVDDA